MYRAYFVFLHPSIDICVVSTFWLLQTTLLWYIEVAKRNLKTTALDQNGGKWIWVSVSKVRGRAETLTAFRLCAQYFLSVWLLALIFRRRKGGECSCGRGAAALCPEAPWSRREDWIQQLLSAHGSQSSVEMGRAECVSASLPHWLCGLGSFSCFSEPGVVVKIRWDDMCPVRQGQHQAPSAQRAGAAAPWGAPGDEEIDKTGSGLWEFSVHPVKGHMMLIGPITGGIDIYQLIKMVFARLLHCKVD